MHESVLLYQLNVNEGRRGKTIATSVTILTTWGTGSRAGRRDVKIMELLRHARILSLSTTKLVLNVVPFLVHCSNPSFHCSNPSWYRNCPDRLCPFWWLGDFILPILEKGSISVYFRILRCDCMPFLDLFINIVRNGTIEVLGKVGRFSTVLSHSLVRTGRRLTHTFFKMEAV